MVPQRRKRPLPITGKRAEATWEALTPEQREALTRVWAPWTRHVGQTPRA